MGGTSLHGGTSVTAAAVVNEIGGWEFGVSWNFTETRTGVRPLLRHHEHIQGNTIQPHSVTVARLHLKNVETEVDTRDVTCVERDRWEVFTGLPETKEDLKPQT